MIVKSFRNSFLMLPFLLGLVFCCQYSQAQDTAEQEIVIQDTIDTGVYAQVIAYWNKGDKFLYELTKKNFEIKNEVETVTKNEEYKLEMEILDSTSEGYTMQITHLTNSNALSDLENMIGSGKTADIVSRYGDMAIIYTTGETGAYIDLKNEEEVMAMYTEMMEAIIDSMKGEEDWNEEKHQKMESLFSQMLTVDYLLNKIFPEILIYHEYFGYEYLMDSIKTYQDTLPNMLGGEGFPAEGEVSCSLDGDVMQAIDLMVTDGEKATTIIVDYLRDLGALDNASEEEISQIKMNINDRNVCRINIAEGIVEHISRTRTVDAGAQKKIETIELKRIVK